MARQHDGTAGHIGVHPPYRLISVDTVMPATMAVSVYSGGFVTMALLALAMVPCGIIVLVTGALSQLGLDIVVLGVAGIFTLAAVLTFKRLNFWTQVDLRRQAAAHGDHTRVRLATVQPTIETVALTEPLMVGVRMRQPVVIAIRAVIALLVLFVVVAGLVAFTGGIPHRSIWTPLLVILTEEPAASRRALALAVRRVSSSASALAFLCPIGYTLPGSRFRSALRTAPLPFGWFRPGRPIA